MKKIGSIIITFSAILLLPSLQYAEESYGLSGPDDNSETSSPNSVTITYVYNDPMTNLSDITQLTGFNYQYSYDEQSGYTATNPNPNYFKIVEEGLEMNIYKGDKSQKKGDSSYPRTEFHGATIIQENIAYVFSFDQFIKEYPGLAYEYCWAQIYAEQDGKPNIMLKWRDKSFELALDQNNRKLKFAGSPLADVGNWVNWRLEFLLSTSNGYVRVYRNNILLGTLTGNTSAKGLSDLKHGIYSIQMDPIGTMTTYTKNLVLYSIN